VWDATVWQPRDSLFQPLEALRYKAIVRPKREERETTRRAHAAILLGVDMDYDVTVCGTSTVIESLAGVISHSRTSFTRKLEVF
jgi:hypothetical protein